MLDRSSDRIRSLLQVGGTRRGSAAARTAPDNRPVIPSSLVTELGRELGSSWDVLVGVSYLTDVTQQNVRASTEGKHATSRAVSLRTPLRSVDGASSPSPGVRSYLQQLRTVRFCHRTRDPGPSRKYTRRTSRIDIVADKTGGRRRQRRRRRQTKDCTRSATIVPAAPTPFSIGWPVQMGRTPRCGSAALLVQFGGRRRGHRPRRRRRRSPSPTNDPTRERLSVFGRAFSRRLRTTHAGPRRMQHRRQGDTGHTKIANTEWAKMAKRRLLRTCKLAHCARTAYFEVRTRTYPLRRRFSTFLMRARHVRQGCFYFRHDVLF
jgi:hypothetical protein